MEMPAELLQAFDRLHEEWQAAESSHDVPFAKSLEKVDGRSNALNRNWSEIENAATSFTDAVKADIEAGARPDLDSAVRFLEGQEKRFRAAFLPRLQVEQQMKRALFMLPQSTRARALASNRREVATYTRLLEGIRDLRLRLIALRALAAPSGDAPTLSDADALEPHSR